jgi:predicted ABC-type ATPase
MDRPPRLVVFAGPNGSGKSTIADIMRKNEKNFPPLSINADDIARECHIGPYEAAAEAEKRRDAALQKKESFVTETVLSHPSKIEFLRRAKVSGYQIDLVYVTTQDPFINIGRVKTRVQTGGHDVPENKTLNRYERSMQLLPQALSVADTAVIYDNSFGYPVVLVQKTFESGTVIHGQQPPSEWSAERVKTLLGTEGDKAVVQ